MSNSALLGSQSGYSGISGYSGYSAATPGTSGYSGISGYSSSASGVSGYSGYSGLTAQSGYSGISGYSAATPGTSGYSGISGYSAATPGTSGYSGYSGISGYSGSQGPSGGGAMPIGTICEWTTTTAPTDFLMCDGTEYDQVAYSSLFAVISTTYNTGGETPGYFRVPNIEGRVVVGLDAGQTEFDTLGETGGSKVPALLWHTHTQDANTVLQAGGVIKRGDSTAFWLAGGTTAPAESGSQTAGNLQPYIVLYKIIKYQVTPEAGGFGDWSAPGDYLTDVNYLASTDGFVVVYGSGYFNVLSDASNPPTTVRETMEGNGYINGSCCPIKAGDYWKLSINSGTVTGLYWIPLLGSGGGGGGGGYGAWSLPAEYVGDTIYQAATDGFVCAFADAAYAYDLTGLVDTFSPPTTERQHSRSHSTYNYKADIAFPVAKGEYWEVTGGGGGTLTVWWKPSGSGSANVEVFTSSGTWTKPAGTTIVKVVCVGGGGGGLDGSEQYLSYKFSGGGGGGGGARVEKIFVASDLGVTESVTVGLGGTAGVAGGTTSFGTKLYAFGGGTGGGCYSGANTDSGGGGGGGSGSAGGNGTGNTSGTAGAGVGGIGGEGTHGAAGAPAECGGGGGGGSTLGADAPGYAGGRSIFGGGGGGSGGTYWSGASITGGAGGASGSWGTGGGGTAGAGAAGGNGADGNGSTCGAGGGGGASRNSGYNGGNGGAWGGGGGGGGCGSNGIGHGAGGTGGNGGVIVYSW